MESFLGLELKYFQLSWSIISNPSAFFEQCNADEEELLRYMTFTIRVGILLRLLVSMVLLVFIPRSSAAHTLAISLLFIQLLVYILARLGAIVSLWLGSWLLNLFAQLAGQSDRLAASRIVAFSSVVSLIPDSGMMSAAMSVIVGLILETIGVHKQYRFRVLRAILVVLGPPLVVIVLLLLLKLIVYPAGLGPFVSPPMHP